MIIGSQTFGFLIMLGFVNIELTFNVICLGKHRHKFECISSSGMPVPASFGSMHIRGQLDVVAGLQDVG